MIKCFLSRKDVSDVKPLKALGSFMLLYVINNTHFLH